MSEDRKSKVLKIVGLYLVILITLQLIATVFLFFHEPSFHKGVPLIVFLGTVLPVILALIFTKFMKVT